MEKKTVSMSQAEYKRFLIFKEVDKIVRGVQRGMREVRKARSENVQLKSARQLVYEL